MKPVERTTSRMSKFFLIDLAFDRDSVTIGNNSTDETISVNVFFLAKL